MATITNTAGDANITVIQNQTFGQILFTTPNTANAIFIAYLSISPGTLYGVGGAQGRKPIKYILGPDTTIRWDNADLNDDLRVQWSWTQMEIQ